MDKLSNEILKLDVALAITPSDDTLILQLIFQAEFNLSIR